MAICIDCSHKDYCTFPRTDTTRMCEEYTDSRPEPKEVDWDLKTMLTDWGFAEKEPAE